MLFRSTDDAPTYGTVSVNGTVITYTPNANWNGMDSFIYTVTDTLGATASATVTMTVTAVNDTPTPVNDTVSTNEDTTLVIDALANDTDVDTDKTLNASPQAPLTLQSVGAASHGTTSIDKGKITYQPAADYNGPDSFTYTVTDGTLTAAATVGVTVVQQNDPPEAVDDTASTPDEDPVTIDVLANDTDVDTDGTKNFGDPHARSDFALTEVTTPGHGTAVILNGEIVYTPEDRFAGSDSFGYTMTDGHGETSSATVNVTVLSVNDPPATPVVSAPAGGERYGGSSTIDVVWSGFDIDGDILTYTLEYFDGTAWIVVETGLTDTTYAFAVPALLGSTTSLRFRVNASDAEYTSDYGYSGTVEVDKDAPVSVTVTMKTADGKTYTAGTWTNQSVTVTAVSAEDASSVTFQYSLEDKSFTTSDNKVVTAGTHNVYVLATDEFGNAAQFGGYLARVDKQQPAVPTIAESVSGTKALLKFTLATDPGGSGNSYMILPDGSRLNAGTGMQYTAAKNGEYTFVLYDVAGNSTTFTYEVTVIDETPPAIACDSGSYRTGDTTQDAITATLTFTDAESAITAKGYQLSLSATPGGAYKSYTGSITIADAGTYYIHAYCQNAFGLTTYRTFGPFIVEAAAEPTPTPESAEATPEPDFGDVEVRVEDVEDAPEGTLYIRLPGTEEWSETLTLEGVGPGTYLVETIDEDGNVGTAQVRVTMRDIIARNMRGQSGSTWGAYVAAACLLLLLLFLAFGFNVRIRIYGRRHDREHRLHTVLRVRRRKDTVIVKLSSKQIRGGVYGAARLSRGLTKRMRDRWFVVLVNGEELFRARIPDDAKDPFVGMFRIDDER